MALNMKNMPIRHDTSIKPSFLNLLCVVHIQQYHEQVNHLLLISNSLLESEIFHNLRNFLKTQ